MEVRRNGKESARMPFGEGQARRRYKFQVSAKAQKADLPCEPQELNVGFWILVSPNVYIIAGPNGAGKTTFAREFLPKYADCPNFVNADLIAQGLSPFSPETAAFRAGRLMLEEIELSMSKGVDFGFETTLSGRSHLGVIRRATMCLKLWRGADSAARLLIFWSTIACWRIGGFCLTIPPRDLRLSPHRSRVCYA